ncbi:hypothetical protein [Mesorhizobium temperatum]|uniref:hypothetical protein n=1 Tax=Mesorhizobium temperatum TaxID=241416 RepID=UPI0011813E30|nr:hypothetical protein [Mesorhizobium temperatum]
MTTLITIKAEEILHFDCGVEFSHSEVYKPKFKPRDAARAPPALTKPASHVLFAQIFGPGHHALPQSNIRTYQ